MKKFSLSLKDVSYEGPPPVYAFDGRMQIPYSNRVLGIADN